MKLFGMILWQAIDVAEHERYFLYRRNRLEKILGPGRHTVTGQSADVKWVRYDISGVDFTIENSRFFIHTHKALLESELEWFELASEQVGLLYRNNVLYDILSPGTFKAVWRGVDNIRLDVVDIADHFALDDSLLKLMNTSSKASQARNVASSLLYTQVPDEYVGLLKVNGKLERQLSTGQYGFWRYNRSVEVGLVDMRLQAMDVSGQEILTKDRVSLRINLSASYRVLDPASVALKVNDFAGFVYKELQLQLREAVGVATLDELLADKNSLNSVILLGLEERFNNMGIALIGVGVKDIILPGDMKTILNKVVEAQKESEANLIKRREETQAMRSLHNTAKLMENNPVLIRLKELEALERVTERVDKITVFGGLDGVLNDLVKIGPVHSALAQGASAV